MQEKQVRNQKPSYKRWWLIALVIFFVIVGTFGACSAPSEVSGVAQIEEITETLAEFGLSDFEIDTVIDLMQEVAEGELLNNYTFELVDHRQDEPIGVEINIVASDADIQTVNMLEFRGLNSQNAFLVQGSSVPYSLQYLGRGTVEGREVYAVATPNHVIDIRGSISLYEVSDDTIRQVGLVDSNGEVSWHSTDRISSQNLPLHMEIGRTYEQRGEIRRVYNEILGPINVTIGERQFQNCIWRRSTDIMTMPGVSGSVMFFHSYYYEGFGRVLAELRAVAILDTNVTVTIENRTHFAGEIEPSQMLRDDEIYPFIREGSSPETEALVTTDWITVDGGWIAFQIPPTWDYGFGGEVIAAFYDTAGGVTLSMVASYMDDNYLGFFDHIYFVDSFQFNDGTIGTVYRHRDGNSIYWISSNVFVSFLGSMSLFENHAEVITAIVRTLTSPF